MNTDDFEKQLQRHPLRALPAEWRQEILNPAKGAVHSRSSTFNPQSSSWWRELLWPCPQAWAGLAAVWLVIFGLHLLAGSEPGSPAQLAAVPPSPEWRAALEEQRRLFTELLPPPEPPPIRHREPADRPRSERREEERFSIGQFVAPRCNESFV
jgi:hypothetical protein